MRLSSAVVSVLVSALLFGSSQADQTVDRRNLQKQQPWSLPSLEAWPSIHEDHKVKAARTSSPKYVAQEPDRSACYVWSLGSYHTQEQSFPAPSPSDPPGGARRRSPSSSASSTYLNWTLSNANRSIVIPALFPSSTHLDLLNAGIIEDPNIELNEGLVRWVAEEPFWSYSADLKPILSHVDYADRYDSFWLLFEGLDTVTDIRVGGQHVARTKNQHITYSFDVTDHINELLESLGRNHSGQETIDTNLTLTFWSPTKYADSEYQRYGPHYPDQVESPDKSRTSTYEYPNRIFVRKQQSDFGWDWGPAYLSSGPHKPGYLIGLGADRPGHCSQQVFVHSSGVDIYRKGQLNNLPPDPDANWIVNVTLDLIGSGDLLDVDGDEKQRPTFRVEIPELDLVLPNIRLSGKIKRGLNLGLWASFEVPSRSHNGKCAPQHWWPAGYGEPKMYDLFVTSEQLHIELSKRVGFRTAVLDLSTYGPEEVSSGIRPGSRFQLEMNDRVTYVKGTNMIPLDVFSPRVSPDYLRWLLESVRLANQNLIRIWGGGSYPSAEFMDLCDELGIMVWTDMMFAASLYPSYDSFLDTVRQEVTQITRKITSHPSTVATVGNNEGELYFLGGYGTRPEDPDYLRRYEKLFDEVIRDTILANSRSLSYIPCSTTTGYISLYPKYVPRYNHFDKQIELHGTGEHYGYNANYSFDISSYPSSRFMVEFGMFSFPNLETFQRVLRSNASYEVDSPSLRAHLKHPPAGNLSYPFPTTQGMRELEDAITTWFPPIVASSYTSTSDPSSALAQRQAGWQTLARWTYLTQLYQSLFMQLQVSFYRYSAATSSNNRGLIIWQLNDVWEAISWSSVDSTGRWKLVHYGLAAVQAPVIALPLYNQTWDHDSASRPPKGAISGESDSLQLVLVSDGGRQMEGESQVEVELQWFSFHGQLLNATTIHSKVEASTIDARPILTVENPQEQIRRWINDSFSSASSSGTEIDPDLRRSRGGYLQMTTRTATTITTLHWMHPKDLKRVPPGWDASNLIVSRPSPPDHRKNENDDGTITITNTGNLTALYISVTLSLPTVVGYFQECFPIPNQTQQEHPQQRQRQSGTFCTPQNTFFLRPAESKTLHFVTPSSQQHETDLPKDWWKHVSLQSLWDHHPGPDSS